jgi:hypothetical protein
MDNAQKFAVFDMDSCQSQLNQLPVMNFLFDLTHLYNFKYYTIRFFKKTIRLIMNNIIQIYKNKILKLATLTLTYFSGKTSLSLIITHCLSDINYVLARRT